MSNSGYFKWHNQTFPPVHVLKPSMEAVFDLDKIEIDRQMSYPSRLIGCSKCGDERMPEVFGLKPESNRMLFNVGVLGISEISTSGGGFTHTDHSFCSTLCAKDYYQRRWAIVRLRGRPYE